MGRAQVKGALEVSLEGSPRHSAHALASNAVELRMPLHCNLQTRRVLRHSILGDLEALAITAHRQLPATPEAGLWTFLVALGGLPQLGSSKLLSIFNY